MSPSSLADHWLIFAQLQPWRRGAAAAGELELEELQLPLRMRARVHGDPCASPVPQGLCARGGRSFFAREDWLAQTYLK